MINKQASFTKMLETILANGVGFKKIYFLCNYSYDEIYSEDFEPICKFDNRGDLVIKFSDGVQYLGGLKLTKNDFKNVFSDIPVDEWIELKLDFDYLDYNVGIYLRFETEFKSTDGTVGEGMIDVFYRYQGEGEKQKEYFEI
ncbi:MAG: hypothetical protein WCQ32_02105 [bacterium]